MASEQHRKPYKMEDEGFDVKEAHAGDFDHDPGTAQAAKQSAVNTGEAAEENAEEESEQSQSTLTLKSVTTGEAAKGKHTAKNLKDETTESASEAGQNAGETVVDGKETTGSLLQQAYTSLISSVSSVSTASKSSVSKVELEADSVLLEEAFSL
ncbi:hypothetical protein R1flu_013972 [Riccia fluitans]|uniref:Uncharacterized protein n=1 Tax=Riccia fluitans TaxID=41844 RepID=A0ABD1YF46_9MARC